MPSISPFLAPSAAVALAAVLQQLQPPPPIFTAVLRRRPRIAGVDLENEFAVSP
jgi:hypothetical protein